MDTIKFSDIFKSNFLEKTTSFSLIDSIIGLVVAFLLGFSFMLFIRRPLMESFTHIHSISHYL